MKKQSDVIVMKKLTTRGLQALAGGPSKLRSASGKPATDAPPAAGDSGKRLSEKPSVQPSVPALAKRDASGDARAKDIESSLEDALKAASADLGKSTTAAPEPRRTAGPPPLPPSEAPPRLAAPDAPPPPPAPTHAQSAAHAVPQMNIATPPTLIHAEQQIPDEIRQLAIRALQDQKALPPAAGTPSGSKVPPPAAAAAPASKNGAISTPAPVAKSIRSPELNASAKNAVTPVSTHLPGAPAVVRGAPLQVVERRKVTAGWTAMLLALGVFVGLSTAAFVHGDAQQVIEALKSPAPPVVAPGNGNANGTEPPPAVAPLQAPAPIAAPQAPAAVVADNKPADVKDDPKPKPDPKPEVTKPDPAPKPAQKPANAYASTRVASDDKPAAKPKAQPAPKPAAKDKDDDAVAAAPAPRPAPKADDDATKISQMAQQQLGASIP